MNEHPTWQSSRRLGMLVGYMMMLAWAAGAVAAVDHERIQPYPENPFYWQYKGTPTLLLGASDYHNIFQRPDLVEHLDLMQSVGGNYVRNTMASREIKPGHNDRWPYRIVRRTDDPLINVYDLNQWDDEYWRRFSRMLEETAARGIIVEVELWERHDCYRTRDQAGWLRHPYNPDNNVNYTAEESGLPIGEWTTDPGHPLFATVPRLQNNTLVLRYQEAFIDKVLSYTLPYDHVLYNMNNETKEHHYFGEYWADYILAKARAAGKRIELTDMQDAHDVTEASVTRVMDSDVYTFVDISQNNFQKQQTHWERIEHIRNHLRSRPRPITNIKVYGSDNAPPRIEFWGNTRDGVERFWRNIFGGCSSARFHRPDWGIGLNEVAQANVKSMRMLTDAMHVFTCEPRNDLLSDRSPNEAYCLAEPGRQYAVYFPAGGQVKLDVSEATGSLQVRWLDISRSAWQTAQTLRAAGTLELKTPGTGHWAALVRADRQTTVSIEADRFLINGRHTYAGLAPKALGRLMNVMNTYTGSRGFTVAPAIGLALVMAAALPGAAQTDNVNRIQPYQANPFYWQHNGKPVVLLGGSDEDNPFQWTGNQLTGHLDLLVSVGGNYLRNTMSDRDDANVYAFQRVEGGRYDLSQWNDEYWNRLRFFLDETRARGIIVQLTLWDQHDHGGGLWRSHPWNPDNNINYDREVIRDRNGFYAALKENNTEILYYQRRFIDQLTSITLDYPHVLYNINNESWAGVEWENFWAAFLHRRASEKGTTIHVTNMHMRPWVTVRHVLTHQELYSFIEISQNNQDSIGGRGHAHWQNIMQWRAKLATRPMPMNNEKIYGVGEGANYSAGDGREAVRRFWRNLFAGCASMRFHRPADDRWGIGLSPVAQAQLKAMRIDVSAAQGTLQVRWLDINRSTWGQPQKIDGSNTL